MTEIRIGTKDNIAEVPLLDFKMQGRNGAKVSITLPVLGEATVPLGVIVAAGAVDEVRDGSPQEQARVLYQLLESIRGAWPEEGRKLYTLDFQTAIEFFEAWFNASVEGGFDPKVLGTTSS